MLRLVLNNMSSGKKSWHSARYSVKCKQLRKIFPLLYPRLPYNKWAVNPSIARKIKRNVAIFMPFATMIKHLSPTRTRKSGICLRNNFSIHSKRNLSSLSRTLIKHLAFLVNVSHSFYTVFRYRLKLGD